MSNPGTQLYLKPEEAKFLGLAVIAMIEQLQQTSKDQNIPWNPESRKDLKEMLAAGGSLRIKLEKLGFDMRPLPDYNDGEHDNYFTKQS